MRTSNPFPLFHSCTWRRKSPRTTHKLHSKTGGWSNWTNAVPKFWTWVLRDYLPMRKSAQALRQMPAMITTPTVTPTITTPVNTMPPRILSTKDIEVPFRRISPIVSSNESPSTRTRSYMCRVLRKPYSHLLAPYCNILRHERRF